MEWSDDWIHDRPKADAGIGSQVDRLSWATGFCRDAVDVLLTAHYESIAFFE